MHGVSAHLSLRQSRAEPESSGRRPHAADRASARRSVQVLRHARKRRGLFRRYAGTLGRAQGGRLWRRIAGLAGLCPGGLGARLWPAPGILLPHRHRRGGDPQVADHGAARVRAPRLRPGTSGLGSLGRLQLVVRLRQCVLSRTGARRSTGRWVELGRSGGSELEAADERSRSLDANRRARRGLGLVQRRDATDRGADRVSRARGAHCLFGGAHDGLAVATSRVTRERAARLMVIVLAVGIPIAGLMALAIRPLPPRRGTTEAGGRGAATQGDPPLYMALGIDIDAPHPAEVVPPALPSAVRGAALGLDLAVLDLQPETLRARSPSQAWQALRLNASLARLGDAQLWDLVAFAWREGAGPGALKESEGLYNANCAACHGSQGAGDGVFAQSLSRAEDAGEGMGELKPPADFTDATQMLGASSALLQGKILRGGMGTGMPSWGPIFSERQIWALVDYLWTFQFDDMEDR